jgi:hypothetical protein
MLPAVIGATNGFVSLSGEGMKGGESLWRDCCTSGARAATFHCLTFFHLQIEFEVASRLFYSTCPRLHICLHKPSFIAL